ncbi:TetR/AcrR family transcriptional regulator [Dactylosporangium cerinum]
MIVATGLQILDRDGLDALTMRRVAQELDTGPASLYVYVNNRDDLMAAMLDTALGHVTLPDKGAWQERLHALATATIEAMSRHEGLALVALGGIPTGLNALRILDRMLALLKEGGLDDTTAAWAIDLIYLHITAAAAEQSAYNAKQMTEADHLADVDRHYASLPADQYPMITRMREPLLSSGDRDRWGLRVLLNGILNTPAVARPKVGQ